MSGHLLFSNIFAMKNYGVACRILLQTGLSARDFTRTHKQISSACLTRAPCQFNYAPQLSSTGRLVPMADQLVAAQRPSSAQLADQRRRCLVPFQACSHVQGVLEPGIPGAIWSVSASAGVQRKPIRCLFTAATVAASYTPPEPK